MLSPEGAVHALEPRAAALFALVAVEGDIARQRVARLLWPDSEAPRARQALRQQLLRIRKLAGEDLLAGDPALALSARVATDLDTPTLQGEFLGAVQYDDGSELESWVAGQREASRRARTGRVEASLAQAEAAGDFAAAVAHAQALVAADERSEAHHRSLMRAHYLAGDTARAQAAYERLSAMLAREFDAEPSAPTEQLLRTIAAGRVVAGAATSLRVAPPSVLRPPRLVGRDAHWAALEAGWTAARPIVLVGEAGIGKTRLVTDFAASRGEVFVVAARPGDALASYSFLARLVRQLVARVRVPLEPGLRHELARLLPEMGRAEALRDPAGLARLLRAIERLVGLAIDAGLAGAVIDDLHHADDATIEALGTVLLADARLRLVVASRPGTVGTAAQALLDALLQDNGGERIGLEPLAEAAVAEFIDSLQLPGFEGARLAPALVRHASGNPLFILETLKAMLAAGHTPGANRLPAAGSVTALIGQRLATLTPDALRLARCAAIAGQDFSVELAAHVLGVRTIDLADAWAELERGQVLRDGAFAHDLIHEAALASVPELIARGLHGQIAAFLDGHGMAVARVAEHWFAAGRSREAGDAFVRAAREARDAVRRLEEGALLARAAACFEACNAPDERFDALEARVLTMLVVDIGDPALAAVEACEAAARSEDQALRALAARAEYLDAHGETEAALEVGYRGIELARSASRMDFVVRFSGIAAASLGVLRRTDEALALLVPLRPWVAANLEGRRRGEYLIYLGVAFDLANRLGEAIEAFEEARAIAVEAGLKDMLAFALSNLSTTSSKRGRLSAAADFGRQALGLWKASDRLAGTPMQTQILLAHRLRDLGRYSESVALLEEAIEEFERAGMRDWIFSAAHRLALAWSHLGQHARAIRLMADEPDGLAVKARAIWYAHRAEVARLSGGDAGTPIRTALDLLGDELDDGNNRLVGLIAAVIVPAAQGETIATSTAAWASARERFGMAIAAHVRAAACALAQGAAARALPQVEAALRLHRDYEPDNFYLAELWWTAAGTYEALGRGLEATRMVRAGRDWIDRTAAVHVAEPFRDSFLHRNRVNRSLLTAGLRLAPPPGTA